MNHDEFCRRLGSGEEVSCVYHRSGLTGVIAARREAASFVLTWTECPTFGQADESHRADRYEFPSADAVLAFVVGERVPVSEFGTGRIFDLP